MFTIYYCTESDIFLLFFFLKKGHIGRTFTCKPANEEIQAVDNFTAPNKHQLAKARILGSGIDPNDPDFIKSKWFYDTPGVLHEDQVS